MRQIISLTELKSTSAGKRRDNQHLFDDKVKQKRQKRKVSPNVIWMEGELQTFCKDHGLFFWKELQFHEYRKFRFDFAVTDHGDHTIAKLKIGIEYHGLNSKKSGHTTLLGFTKDQEKANLAQSDGWKTMSFTVINYREITSILRRVIG